MASKSPDAFRTISEVADWLGVQPHVLRFWESKFSQVKPVKRAGGRRYYRPNDMLLLGGIRQLLHEDGLTIKGAQKVLREQGMAHVSAMSKPLDEESAALAEEASEAQAAEPVAAPEPDPVPEAGFVEAPEEETPVAAFAPRDEAPAPETPVSEALVSEATAPDVPQTEEPVGDTWAEDGDSGPLPDFLATDTSAPTEPEPVAATTDAEPELPMMDDAADAEPAHAEPPEQLPEFQDFEAAEVPAPDDAPVVAEEPVAAAPDIEIPEPAVEPEAEALKPLIVDAPDPDESLLSAEPSVLSAAFHVSGVNDADRAALTPLVAQLAALRDRMAAARGR
jgi:DNA-binding transcriptional MerR regulator